MYELIEFCTDAGVKGEPIQGKTCLYLSWVCLYKYVLHNYVVFLVPADFCLAFLGFCLFVWFWFFILFSISCF